MSSSLLFVINVLPHPQATPQSPENPLWSRVAPQKSLAGNSRTIIRRGFPRRDARLDLRAGGVAGPFPAIKRLRRARAILNRYLELAAGR